MELSVHDNWLYAQAVDHERCRIVLHTAYPHAQPPEYTDIIFEGVVVHHFEQQMCQRGSDPANVLFGVEEGNPVATLTQHADVLARTKNYGWPVLRYEGIDDLANQLTAGGAKCFDVSGTCGLSGFVFAVSMEFRARGSRAEVKDGHE
jgi:hypothetical protein